MSKNVILLISLLLAVIQVKAQEEQQSNFSLNADFVSRYVWRGQLYSVSPNIQPYASFTKGQFTFGTWGSYGLTDQYAEVDFYISWQSKHLGLTVSDYCTLSETPGETMYFKFRNSTTPHALEGTVRLTFSESFPLSFVASTFFYGNDRDSEGNMYSTYFELNYPASYRDFDFNFFAGGTPKAGLYGDKAGIVNVGFSAVKAIKVTETFELPVSASLLANPLANSMYLVFSLTL
jgi:hypothetical protein